MSGYSKYGAIKTTVDGIVFASKKEANRYAQLKLMERGGLISDLKLQPVFPIVIDGAPVMMRNGQPARYTADFAYTEKGKRIVEEIKGFVVRDYPLRRALVEHIYGVKIVEIK